MWSFDMSFLKLPFRAEIDSSNIIEKGCVVLYLLMILLYCLIAHHLYIVLIITENLPLV